MQKYAERRRETHIEAERINEEAPPEGESEKRGGKAPRGAQGVGAKQTETPCEQGACGGYRQKNNPLFPGKGAQRSPDGKAYLIPLNTAHHDK